MLTTNVRAPRKLASHLRVLHVQLCELVPAPHAQDGRVLSVAHHAQLENHARAYLAEMHACAEELRTIPHTGDAEADSEIAAEHMRMQWAVSIWELAVLVFLRRPLVLGESFGLWWLRNFCSGVAEHKLHELSAKDATAPVDLEEFWQTLRTLIVQGLLEQAVELVNLHPQMRAAALPSAARSAGAASTVETLLMRLEALLEHFPRLRDRQLLQPSPEDVNLRPGGGAALQAFNIKWRVWREDVSELLRSAPPSDPEAKQVIQTARLLAGEEDAIANATGGAWHATLLARLLLSEPTRLRWDIHELLPSAEGLPLEEKAMLAILADNPYAARDAIRAAHGDGWLVTHLWDILWRARIVELGTFTADSTLDSRQFSILQYAKALGEREPLWQLAVEYASDVQFNGQLCDEARAFIIDLLKRHETLRLHAFKVRKLLHVCERFNLTASAHELLNAYETSQRAKRGAAPAVAEFAARAAVPPIEALFSGDAVSTEDARLKTIAQQALEEALAISPLVRGGGSKAEAPMLAELRAKLRSASLATPGFYDGPQWLPSYLGLLELLHSGTDDAVKMRQLCISFFTVTLGAVPTFDVPQPVVDRLLALLAAVEKEPALPEHFTLMPPTHRWPGDTSPPLFDVADTYTLLAHAERLKAQVPGMSAGVCAGGSLLAHSLREREQGISHRLIHNLADAFLT